jgi:hypothetical protein
LLGAALDPNLATWIEQFVGRSVADCVDQYATLVGYFGRCARESQDLMV